MTLRNTADVDIIATDQSTNKSANIQVKSTSHKRDRQGFLRWMLDEKAEKLRAGRLFYVFLSLEYPAEFYVVPSRKVADYVTKDHREWMRSKGRHGQKHKRSNVRIWWSDERYRNKWNLLRLN